MNGTLPSYLTVSSRLMSGPLQQQNESIQQIAFNKDKLNKDVSFSKDEIQEIKDKYQTILNENEQLRSQNTFLQEKLEISAQRISTYQEINENIKRSLQDATQQIADKDKIIEQLRKKCSDLTAQQENKTGSRQRISSIDNKQQQKATDETSLWRIMPPAHLQSDLMGNQKDQQNLSKISSNESKIIKDSTNQRQRMITDQGPTARETTASVYAVVEAIQTSKTPTAQKLEDFVNDYSTLPQGNISYIPAATTTLTAGSSQLQKNQNKQSFDNKLPIKASTSVPAFMRSRRNQQNQCTVTNQSSGKNKKTNSSSNQSKNSNDFPRDSSITSKNPLPTHRDLSLTSKNPMNQQLPLRDNANLIAPNYKNTKDIIPPSSSVLLQKYQNFIDNNSQNNLQSSTKQPYAKKIIETAAQSTMASSKPPILKKPETSPWLLNSRYSSSVNADYSNGSYLLGDKQIQMVQSTSTNSFSESNNPQMVKSTKPASSSIMENSNHSNYYQYQKPSDQSTQYAYASFPSQDIPPHLFMHSSTSQHRRSINESIPKSGSFIEGSESTAHFMNMNKRNSLLGSNHLRNNSCLEHITNPNDQNVRQPVQINSFSQFKSERGISENVNNSNTIINSKQTIKQQIVQSDTIGTGLNQQINGQVNLNYGETYTGSGQNNNNFNLTIRSFFKENDISEHLAQNEEINLKKRDSILYASRRDSNCQLPSSPQNIQQYTPVLIAADEMQQFNNHKDKQNQQDPIQTSKSEIQQSYNNVESSNDNRNSLKTQEPHRNNLRSKYISAFEQPDNLPQQQFEYPQRSTKLLENFIVISADAEKIRQQLILLSKKNELIVQSDIVFQAIDSQGQIEIEQLKAISSFCFPHGVQVIRSPTSKNLRSTKSGLHKGEYFVFPVKSAESFETKVQHDTALGEACNPNKFTYCICISTKEQLEVLGAQKFSKDNTTYSNEVVEIKTIYCAITKLPLFDFFLEVIQKIIDSIYPSQASDIFSLKGFLTSQLAPRLESLLREDRILEFGSQQAFIIGKNQTALLTIPHKEQCYLLEGKWGPLNVFAMLKAKEFIFLLFSFLIEDNLVFCSHDASILSQVMMLFLSALKPFNWPHPFIMFLTNNLMHMFDSPFPLVLGINKPFEFIKDQHLLITHPHCVFIDLDNFFMSSKKQFIYDSTIFQRLSQRISGDFEAIAIALRKLDSSSGQISELTTSILSKTRSFFQNLLSQILPPNPILGTNQNLDYDRIKKIAVDNEGNKDYFLSKFVQTQVFSYFIEQFYQRG